MTVTARLCHLPNPAPRQPARLEVDGELVGAWTTWPAEIVLGEVRYLHLAEGVYLRWQR